MDVGNKQETGIGFILRTVIFLILVGIGIFIFMPTVNENPNRWHSNLEHCRNNLRTLGIALHEYHGNHQILPLPRGNFSTQHPHFSWRVALLPSLGQTQLYDRYNFNETWDGQGNSKLHHIPLEILLCPETSNIRKNTQRTVTDYIIVTGEETLFNEDQPTSFKDVKDGLSNTLMFGELVNSDIHWMEPRDLDFNAISKRINADGASISSAHEGGANVAFVDGSVRFLSEDIDPEVLRALMTKSGGETVGEY